LRVTGEGTRNQAQPCERGERRGFAPGNPLEDWVQAEIEIDRLLAEGRLGG